MASPPPFRSGLALTLLALGALASCKSAAPEQSGAVSLEPALASVTAGELLADIEVLASDAFEGRAPGTRGETLTVDYLQKGFARRGAAPGNPDGTYVQDVPLVAFQATPRLALTLAGEKTTLAFPGDYVARSRRLLPSVAIAGSELVFAGYGIVAPEYGWDDFKDVEVAGKTLIVLEGEPELPAPADGGAPFRGETLTYYGNRFYKYEVAAAKGAAALLIVHDPASAATPYPTIQKGFQAEAYEVRSASRPEPLAAEGWITLDAVERVCTRLGKSFGDLRLAAQATSFRPRALGAKVDLTIDSVLRDVPTRNVVARIAGSDPKLRHELVVYTAHWDHLGRDESLQGDQIYNGAIDNAAGVATLLEIAEAFARLPTPPRRSILFLATTAEERFYLGAKHYVAAPLYPLADTVANINLDASNLWGRTEDVLNLAYGATTLDDVLEEAAAAQGRKLVREQFDRGAYFFRSDVFEFARAGIPAVFPSSGSRYIGKPEGYGDEKWDAYGSHDYHQLTDDVRADWDMAGAVEDGQWLFRVGYLIAQSDTLPAWQPESEFRTRR